MSRLGSVQEGRCEREGVLPAAQVAQRRLPLHPCQHAAAAHACAHTHWVMPFYLNCCSTLRPIIVPTEP